MITQKHNTHFHRHKPICPLLSYHKITFISTTYIIYTTHFKLQFTNVTVFLSRASKSPRAFEADYLNVDRTCSILVSLLTHHSESEPYGINPSIGLVSVACSEGRTPSKTEIFICRVFLFSCDLLKTINCTLLKQIFF